MPLQYSAFLFLFHAKILLQRKPYFRYRECKTQLDVCQHAELDERTFCNEAVETHFCETAKSKSSSPNFVEKQRTVHDKETRYSSNECADSNEYSLLDELI